MSSPDSVRFPFAGTELRIDEETLREVPDDLAAIQAWCEMHPEDPRVVSGLRLLDRLEEAEELGRRVLEDPSLSPLQRAARRARLARVLHWQGRYVEAEEEFAIAAEETGFDDPIAPQPLLLLATILQQRATSRFDQWQREALSAHADPERARRLRAAATEDAERALAIRTGCGAGPAQLASSRQTLRRLTEGA